MLGVDYELLQKQKGVEIYDNRFDTSLVGLVFLALKAAKKIRFPEFILFEQSVLRYYIEHPQTVEKTRKKWKDIRSSTGVITPLSIVKNEPIETQIERYLEGGVIIDRYSEPNRYPHLFDEVKKIRPQSIVEFGTGAADNLLYFQDSAKLVGNDLDPISIIIDNPLLHQYRWKDNPKKMKDHLKKIGEAQIEFVKGDMFDEEVLKQIFSNLPRPMFVSLCFK